MAHFGRFYYSFFVLYRIIVLYNTDTNHWTDFVMDLGNNYVHPQLGIFFVDNFSARCATTLLFLCSV